MLVVEKYGSTQTLKINRIRAPLTEIMQNRKVLLFSIFFSLTNLFGVTSRALL